MFINALSVADVCHAGIRAQALLPAKHISMLPVQEDVDDLIVVGGASRMPWLRKALRNHFPQRTVMHMTDADINAVHMTRPAL